MAGYATLSPALAVGPPGWVVWAVGGTLITIGAIWAGNEVLEMSKSTSKAKAEPKAIPKAKEKCKEEKKKHYGARVHAQGRDCGGTSGSTIGVPGINQTTPILVAQGLLMSTGTWTMLNKTQRKVRFIAKTKADGYISGGPSVGGRYGEKSFPATDRKGGKRYDVDAYGDGPSFIS